MKHLIEYRLTGGGTVLVEVDEPEADGGWVRASRAADTIEQAGRSFDEALATIQPAAEAIIGRLRGLAEPADEAEVEFGIKLSGTAGAVIASTAVEANFKVTLVWKHPR